MTIFPNIICKQREQLKSGDFIYTESRNTGALELAVVTAREDVSTILIFSEDGLIERETESWLPDGPILCLNEIPTLCLNSKPVKPAALMTTNRGQIAITNKGRFWCLSERSLGKNVIVSVDDYKIVGVGALSTCYTYDAWSIEVCDNNGNKTVIFSFSNYE